MNLNELNKIEEGIVDAIKDRFQQGGYQTQVQNIFIKDFVQDAITSLNNGVKGGLIDPSIKSNGKPNPAAAQQQDQQPAPGNAAPAGQQYMGKIAPNAGPATKPAAPASPFATPTINQPKTTVSASPTANSKPGNITSGGGGMKMKESAYDKMNRIFESIINIDEETQARTIADFMMDWFSQYMEGVNWQASQGIVKQKVDKLQDEYPANVKQNLTDLARIGLALSKTATPAGAPPEFSQSRKEIGNDITSLKSALDGLAKSNPQSYNELLKSLRPANVKPAG